jgi:hypothetical protein
MGCLYIGDRIIFKREEQFIFFYLGSSKYESDQSWFNQGDHVKSSTNVRMEPLTCPKSRTSRYKGAIHPHGKLRDSPVSWPSVVQIELFESIG